MGARPQGNADFALRLEAANSGTMTGTRIDDDEWPLDRVEVDACRRIDPHEEIVDGPLQLAAIHDQLAAELQDVRRDFRLLLGILLAALLQYVEEQERALRCVDPIRPCVVERIELRRARVKSVGSWRRSFP